jgi:hypothetical protein
MRRPRRRRPPEYTANQWRTCPKRFLGETVISTCWLSPSFKRILLAATQSQKWFPESIPQLRIRFEKSAQLRSENELREVRFIFARSLPGLSLHVRSEPRWRLRAPKQSGDTALKCLRLASSIEIASGNPNWAAAPAMIRSQPNPTQIPPPRSHPNNRDGWNR